MLIREMTREEAWATLAKAEFGRLACASDNQPYIIPFYFSVEGTNLYSFSLPGQKIDWMRTNPRVCVEVDRVANRNDWMSVVASGTYEELTETEDFERERAHAHELLLRSHTMWWQPGAVTVASYDKTQGFVPVFYRIKIKDVTGHRGVPALDER